MASTTTLKYGPKISLSHVTMKGGGGGGPDPFIGKDYENGPFFLQPSLIIMLMILMRMIQKAIMAWVGDKMPGMGFLLQTLLPVQHMCVHINRLKFGA